MTCHFSRYYRRPASNWSIARASYVVNRGESHRAEQLVWAKWWRPEAWVRRVRAMKICSTYVTIHVEPSNVTVMNLCNPCPVIIPACPVLFTKSGASMAYSPVLLGAENHNARNRCIVDFAWTIAAQTSARTPLKETNLKEKTASIFYF
jgi:hypothetical protein